MSKPMKRRNLSPEETRNKQDNLNAVFFQEFGNTGLPEKAEVDFFNHDPTDPETQLILSGASTAVRKVRESPFAKHARKQIEAADRSRRSNEARGAETANLIRPIAKEILEKNPTLSTNAVAERVVERLNGAVSRATAWRHIGKMRKKE